MPSFRSLTLTALFAAPCKDSCGNCSPFPPVCKPNLGNQTLFSTVSSLNRKDPHTTESDRTEICIERNGTTMYRGIFTAPPTEAEGIQMIYLPDRQTIRMDGWFNNRQGALQAFEMPLRDFLQGLDISLDD